MKTNTVRLFLLALAFLVSVRAEAGERDASAVVVAEFRIDRNGDAEVSVKFSGTIPGRYLNDPTRVMRDVMSRRDAARLENVVQSIDPADQSVTIAAVLPGMAFVRRRNFEIDLPDGATLVHAGSDVLVTVHSLSVRGDHIVFVSKMVFPADVREIMHDPEAGVISFDLPGGRRQRPQHGRGELPPSRILDPADIAGIWELSSDAPSHFPKFSLILVVVGDEWGGNVEMDVERNGKFVSRMPIVNCRIFNERVALSAHSETTDGRMALTFDFNIDGRIERDILEGHVTYRATMTGRSPIVINEALRFIKVL